MQQRLVAIGDSITLGHWDPLGGWVARLRKASDEDVIASSRDRYAAVYNLGISSNTSADVHRRYVNEVSARFLGTSDEEAFVVLAVGINDSQLREGKELVSLSSYRKNMNAIIALGLERGHKMVVVGLSPVHEELTDPVGWDRTKAFRNGRIAEFDQAAAAAAHDHGLAFAGLFSDDEFRSQSTHLDWDGLHLNSRGHERVAKVVGQALGESGWRARGS